MFCSTIFSNLLSNSISLPPFLSLSLIPLTSYLWTFLVLVLSLTLSLLSLPLSLSLSPYLSPSLSLSLYNFVSMNLFSPCLFICYTQIILSLKSIMEEKTQFFFYNIQIFIFFLLMPLTVKNI